MPQTPVLITHMITKQFHFWQLSLSGPHVAAIWSAFTLLSHSIINNIYVLRLGCVGGSIENV